MYSIAISHLLKTIYISKTQYFCSVACCWNLFYDIQTVVAGSPKYLYFIIFSTSAPFGVRHLFWRWKLFVTLQLHPYLVILGWSKNLLFPTITDDISWVTCYFSENVSLTNLKISCTNVCCYINHIRWIKPYDISLSLFLIEIVTVGGFRYISQFLFESTFFKASLWSGIAFSNISLLHDNSDNLLTTDLGYSCFVVGGCFEFILM